MTPPPPSLHQPGHPTVDGKVEGVGEADAEVDHQHDVLGQGVVHEFIQTTELID